KKMEWGWNNTITARFLCPMRLISKFDVDPESFRERVQSGKRAIKASDYPMFLYDESKYTPGDISSGLFQGPLLLRFYRHVFTGPSSWKTGSSGGGREARGIMNKLKAPTPRTIAYVAIMVRWALSSSTKFLNNDQGFNLVDFYQNILMTFNERVNFDDDYEVDQITTEWITTTLRWWKLYVYYVLMCNTIVTSSGMYSVYRKGVPTWMKTKSATMMRATLQSSKPFGR
ncbi:hypothetical protein JOM56_014996, partial [Amanita muscaria]